MRGVVLTGTFDDPRVEFREPEEPAEEPVRVVVEVVAAGISKVEPYRITKRRGPDGMPRRGPVALAPEVAGHVR